MTPTQKAQFNRMRDALKDIGTHYMTPAQIQSNKEKVGLGYTEYLEMSYENMQILAKSAVRGVKTLA